MSLIHGLTSFLDAYYRDDDPAFLPRGADRVRHAIRLVEKGAYYIHLLITIIIINIRMIFSSFIETVIIVINYHHQHFITEDRSERSVGDHR